MTTKHEPGKLRVEYVGARNCEDGSMADVCEIRNEGGDLIADFMDKDTAHLFAAAPDLLAACEALVAWDKISNGCSQKVVDQARQAIARAPGRDPWRGPLKRGKSWGLPKLIAGT